MTTRRQRRRAGGWIMLAVIFVLLALALAVTAFYTQSEDHMYLGNSMAAYHLAATRAELGAQEALARIRSGVLNVGVLDASPPCNSGTVDPLAYTPATTPPGPAQLVAFPPPVTCGTILGPVDVDNGPGLDLKAGGGLQYRWVVYRPNEVGAAMNLYAVRATGFYGYQGSPNLYTSMVELTVMRGSNLGSYITTDTYDNVTQN